MTDLFAAAVEILEPLGFEVLELDVSGSGTKRRVLLRIDRLDEELVTMEDVTLATDVFGLELDRLDPFKEAYRLEVESPGSARPLFTKRHFERFHDLDIKVKKQGDSFKGKLRGVTDRLVQIEVDGGTRELPLQDFASGTLKARLAEWPETPR